MRHSPLCSCSSLLRWRISWCDEMLEAGLAWLALIGFEIVQTVRGKATLSQFVWAAGRHRRWLKWIGVGLIALLVIHLTAPLLREDNPPPVEDSVDG